tara:strand:+ start:2338 stop:4329 length:1992 start_codon:yes stop_codon:yes gene_type:complete
MSKVKELQEYEGLLEKAKSDGKLTEEGETTLNALKSGAFIKSPFINNILQGATFNQSDEIAATLRSALTDGLSYEDAFAIEQAALEQSRTDAPIGSTATQMAGAIAPTLLTRGRNINTSVTGQILPGMAFGAAYGAGASDNPNLLSLDRAKDAAIGGVAGGVAAPLTALALKPIEAVAGNIKNLVSTPKVLGQNQARKLIKEALENDAQSVEEAVLYVLNKNSTGKPYTLADLGPNSQALLDAANVLPGEGKATAQAFLKQRDKGILTRLTSDLQNAFGSRAAFFSEFKALQNSRLATGNKLYNRAYRKRIKITPDLEELFKRPSMSSALSRAFKIAKEEGVNLPNIRINAQGKLLSGKNTRVKSLPTQLLHYVKRGLDDEIFTGKSPVSGAGKDLVNAAKGTRIAFLDVLDEQNSAYKMARNYWSGKSAVMDAMTLGNKFLKQDHNILGDEIMNMSLSELEGFRLGAMQGILEEMEKGAERTAVQRLLRSPARLRLLKMTFPQTEDGAVKAQQFIGRLNDEVIMRETSKGVLSGSQTAMRQAIVGTVKDASKRDPIQGFTQLIQQSISKDFKTIADEQESSVASEIAKILVEQNPDKLNAISKDLTNKGLRRVLRKYAPQVAPRLLNLLINPSQIAARAGTGTSQSGFGQALDLGNLLQQNQ